MDPTLDNYLFMNCELHQKLQSKITELLSQQKMLTHQL